MIKYFKDLNNIEMEELRSLYVDYFKSIDDIELSSIEKIVNRLVPKNYEVFVNEMIYRVLSNNYVGVALLDYSEKIGSEAVVGFSVGHPDVIEDTGWISHFYIDMENSSAPKDMILKEKLSLELYSEIAKLFKEMGKTKVATEVSENENAYRSTLKQLSFVPVHDYEDGHVDYGRRI